MTDNFKYRVRELRIGLYLRATKEPLENHEELRNPSQENKIIKTLNADSECAVLDEVRTRRWKGLEMRKTNWRKYVAQER